MTCKSGSNDEIKMILLSLVCVRLGEQKADRGNLYGIHKCIVFCTATNDYEGLGERFGNRAEAYFPVVLTRKSSHRCEVSTSPDLAWYLFARCIAVRLSAPLP